MKKIKVLMPIEYYYPIGGIERFVTNLTNSFSEDIEAVWAVKKFGGNTENNYPKKSASISLNHAKREIWRLFSTNRPDLVFLNNGMPFNLVALIRAKFLKIPSVYFCHQIPLYKTKGLLARVTNHVIWAYLRVITSYCSYFIVPSNSVKREFNKRNFPKRPTVINPGIDPRQFRPISIRKRNILRRKYHLSVNSQVVSWVGRFDRVKRADMVIRAAHNNPQIIFIIAGFKPSARDNRNTLPWIEQNKTDNVKIILTAGPDTIQEIYQVSDVCINTSVYETFGSAIYEAAACGITTVAPNHGGTAESGAEGYLFKYNQQDLENSIRLALENPKKAKHIVTSQQNAEEIEKIFSQLVN